MEQQDAHNEMDLYYYKKRCGKLEKKIQQLQQEIATLKLALKSMTEHHEAQTKDFQEDIKILKLDAKRDTAYIKKLEGEE